MPLIREVDDFLGETEEAVGLVREAHPELCFWALNGGETVKSKKQTQEGYEERLSVLREVDKTAGEAVVEGTEEYGDEADRDDVVDAVALAVTAQGDLETLPEEPPRDERGLPMEMVHSKSQLH
jgi:predicted RNase H-like nuclease